MHPVHLARRKDAAQQRIVEAAQAFAECLALPSSLVEGLSAHFHDPEVKDLLRMEAVANLLEHILHPPLTEEPPMAEPPPQAEVTKPKTAKR